MTRFGLLALLLVGLVGARAESAERTCEDLYFGYTDEPDFAAAYACFDGARKDGRDPVGSYALMVLMRINGEGVTVDLDVATTLLEDWKEADPAPSRIRLHLQRVVLERRAGLAEAEPLGLCSLPADPALAARCDEIERRRDEARHARHVHGRAERLPDAARDVLPRLTVAFGGYAELEAERVKRAGVLDADADVAARVARHRTRVQTQFDRALREVVVDGTLAPASPIEASRAERIATRGFEVDRRERAAAFEVYEKALPDSASTYERHRRRYDEVARQAEASWQRYRDAWVSVARASEVGEADAAKAEAAVRLLLARQRVALFGDRVADSDGPGPSMR